MTCMARPWGGRQIPLSFMVVPMLRSLALLVFVLAPFLGHAARAAESLPVITAHDTATLVTDRDRASPGETLGVGLRLQLKPGWHTYWLNPGDAGEAPRLETDAAGALTGQASRILFPTPVRISEGGLMSYAYTGDVLLPQELHLSGPVSGDTSGHVTLKAHAEWLVCAATCVPEHGDFTVMLPVDRAPVSNVSANQDPRDRASPSPAVRGDASPQAGLFHDALQARPVPSPFRASVSPDGVFELEGQGLSPRSVHKAWFMPSASGVIDQVAPQKLATAPGRISLDLRWVEGAEKPHDLSGIVVLQDDAGQQTPLWIDAPLSAGSAGAGGSGAAPVDAQDAAHEALAPSLLRMLVFAFAGGLILNLMPCVFPVLAMKAFSLARLGGSARRAQIGSALAYTLGVMGSFAALGAAMIVLRGVGSAAGWGFQFQSPVFVIGVAWLLVAMALNLLGVFEVTLGRLGQDVVPRHGPWGDMLTGLLAVVVATPCTAPFMGAAIAGALGGPAWSGMIIFLAMGLGLAAPYLAIATIPVLARHMPKPGAWMAVLKQALAFPLLATSVWLLWVACIQRGAMIVPIALGGAVGIGLAGWLFGLAQRRAMIAGGSAAVTTGRILSVLVLVLVGAALWQVPQEVAPPMRGGDGTAEKAVPYSPEKLAALRKEGKPVFIDMTAAWCITCMVNERVALQKAPVQKAFAEKGIVYMKGDWTNRDPSISAFLRDHGRDGVPLYVYYAPHRDGAILPQILTVSTVLDAIR